MIRVFSFAVAVGLATMSAGVVGGQSLQWEEAREPGLEKGVVNWPAPLYWSTPRPAPPAGELLEKAGASPAAATSTSPLPLIGITPCRVVDTRDASMPPGYGPPSLLPGVPNARSFPMAGHCGIGEQAQAISINVTVTNTLGAGYIVLYPEGSLLPPVSTLNYFAGQTVANAAVVPLGGGGLTVVAGVSGTDLIIDVNGYYAPAGVGAYNTFLGLEAGNFTMTGDANTAMGYQALSSNTLGDFNTAVGVGALRLNTTAGKNIAIGQEALANQAYGNSDTTWYSHNTAVGYRALFNNNPTSVESGKLNTAAGSTALASNTTGFENTAIGFGALRSNQTGNDNIAIGVRAGEALTGGNGNIYIGNPGAEEAGTIRIGLGSYRAFVAGIYGNLVADSVAVHADSDGQLGTLLSSARYKEEIEDMGGASSDLLRLRPVSFRYRGQAGNRRRFGLIAEEVEQVIPELVVCDSAGQPEAVLYDEMPAMLLNELQKQQAQIERQEAQLKQLRRLVSELIAGE